jgi:hypothetical protein
VVKCLRERVKRREFGDQREATGFLAAYVGEENYGLLERTRESTLPHTYEGN